MASKKKSSPIWNFFTVVDNITAKCDICKTDLSYKSSVSNLKKHLQRRHPTIAIPNSECTEKRNPLQDEEIISDPIHQSSASASTSTATSSNNHTDLISVSEEGERNAKRRKTTTFQTNLNRYIPKQITVTQKKKIDSELVKMFYVDFQPFSMVRDAGFKSFVRALNPNYEIPDRRTISSSIIPAMFEKCLNNTKEMVLHNLNDGTNVCLTTDCWTSSNNDAFMAITVHFINKNFELKSVLLSCEPFSERHTGVNLADRINEILVEWGLDKKIALAVSDNATNIKNALSIYLKFKHFGCFAHTLNLIVQNGLKIDNIQTVITKIKTIVSFFKRSSSANHRLIEFQKNLENSPKKLLQDVPTRWNSTFYMMKRFIELEDAIKSTVAIVGADLPVLSANEWHLTKELTKILSPFEAATRAVSGEDYLTASMVIVLNEGLNNACNKLKQLPFSDVAINLINNLLEDLHKRVGQVEYSNTLALCTFLDPRFKNIPFQQQDAQENVRKNVVNLVAEQIAAKTKDQLVTATTVYNTLEEKPDSNEVSIWETINKTFSAHKPSGTPKSRAIMEVQRYLEDEILERTGNPCLWWKNNQFNYPYLSQVFKERCGLLGSSVPCERLFSKAGNILNERRTRLSVVKVQQLLFLNMNHEYIN